MEARTSPNRPQGLIVGGFGVGQIVAFASSFYLMGVLGDAIGRDLGLSSTFVFGMVSLSLAVPALIAPRVAKRIDAKGGKQVLLASHIALAAGLVLVGLAQNGVGLAIGMAVIGLGQALGLSPTPFAILVSLYGDAARRPITAVALIGGLGSVVGWPLTAWLAEQVGWRGTHFVWAAVQILVCLPLTAWLCPKTPGHGPRAKGHHAPVRWDRPMAQLAVLFACAWFISTCMSAHLPRLLGAFGLSPHAAAAAAGLMGIAAVTVRFLEFTVLRRLPPLATTRLATLMHPTGAAALLTFGAPAGAVMAMGQGAGNGMLTVAKGVLPLSLYGPDNYAYRSALIGRPALFAQIAGPAAFALALERSATLAILGTSALCLVMFAMTFGLIARPHATPEPVIA
ncbi:MAG: MFS transporter [Alphaproteobacteria bacterium]|nr:MFS transporter [Alphaproteobacteria bacterium]MBU1516500.1 MFS transporter [Alphaproteobacteria bacterium]MBU2094257.1 MFS transporter [Alphaproteobacteria bacterium]MBU2154166.1 MFS transporter [Alphaproteobacteria bacterium]MBU2307427.1 MFS transporter [Alphaproteobacteria bacterium]